MTAINNSTVTRTHPNATPRSGEFTAPQQARPLPIHSGAPLRCRRTPLPLPTGRVDSGPHSTSDGLQEGVWEPFW